jgi:hypothetical protein
MWGAVAGAVAPMVFDALGGLFGGSDYQRPEGTIGTDQVIKMLKSGMKPEQIAQIAPMSSRFMGHAQKKLMKHGLSPEQIQMLRGGSMGMGGGPGAAMGGGPMGMGAFQAMMPAIMSNSSAFANPAAAGWLQSLFPQSPGGVVPGNYPGGGTSPLPLGGGGGFAPWRSPGKPGPAPSPFVGLNRLSGPFGNGGGPMVPGMQNMMTRFGAR